MNELWHQGLLADWDWLADWDFQAFVIFFVIFLQILFNDYYRPQRSCGKVIFLHLSVILSTGDQVLLQNNNVTNLCVVSRDFQTYI